MNDIVRSISRVYASLYWLKCYEDLSHLIPPASRAVTRSFLEREVKGSNLGLVKSDAVLPTARHFVEKVCVVCRHNDAETGPANSLHASA